MGINELQMKMGCCPLGIAAVTNPADQLAWHRVLSTLDGVGPATMRRLSSEIGLDDQDDALARFIDGAGRMPSAAEVQASELRSALGDCMAAHDSGLTPAEQIDQRNWIELGDLEAFRQAIWTMVHGIVSMHVLRPDVDWKPDLLDQSIEGIIRGWLTPESSRHTST